MRRSPQTGELYTVRSLPPHTFSTHLSFVDLQPKSDVTYIYKHNVLSFIIQRQNCLCTRFTTCSFLFYNSLLLSLSTDSDFDPSSQKFQGIMKYQNLIHSQINEFLFYLKITSFEYLRNRGVPFHLVLRSTCTLERHVTWTPFPSSRTTRGDLGT